MFLLKFINSFLTNLRACHAQKTHHVLSVLDSKTPAIVVEYL